MTFRRKLSWSTAMRDIRKDHTPVIVAGTLVHASGRFNLTAIMRAAAALARRAYGRDRAKILTWQQQMAGALRYVWKQARVEMLVFVDRAAARKIA